MTFGEAIEVLKEGKHVTREGWNGKGQFVLLIKGERLSDALGVSSGGPFYTDVLAIVTTNNKIQVGWLASQTDMLCSDWIIV